MCRIRLTTDMIKRSFLWGPLKVSPHVAAQTVTDLHRSDCLPVRILFSKSVQYTPLSYRLLQQIAAVDSTYLCVPAKVGQAPACILVVRNARACFGQQTG
jgi:hypothetical protein